MMPSMNIACRIWVTITAIVIGVCAPANAQTRSSGALAPLPDLAATVLAFDTVRRWVDDFETPSQNEPGAAVPLNGVSGVYVALRHNGRLLGAGSAVGDDDHVLLRATRRAMGEALGAIGAIPRALAIDFGARMAVEVEVAGAPVPLVGRAPGDLASQIEPGLDGIGLRRGDQQAARFPAQMAAANNAAEAEHLLIPLAAEIELSHSTPAQILARTDVSVYRFRTIHLAERTPRGDRFEAFRSDEHVSIKSVTRQSIAQTADRLARHILRSRSPGPPSPPGLLGDYRPTHDAYAAPFATNVDQALAAFALAHYSQTPGVDAATARKANQVAQSLILDLVAEGTGRPDPYQSTLASAAVVHAIVELHHDARRDMRLNQGLIQAMQQMTLGFRNESGFVESDPDARREFQLPPHLQALCLSAQCRLLGREAAVTLRPETIRRELDRLWEQVPMPEHVSLLPWMGWAELDYARATGEPLARQEELRRIRSVLGGSRLGSPDRPASADLHGGFDLRPGGRVDADAHTLRPTPFLGTMLADERLTPSDEVPLSLGLHFQTMRFLMQLTVRESSTWRLPNAPRALGGVRAAVWDSDQPVMAQTLGLLSATETLRGLQRLEQRLANPQAQ